VQSKITKFSQSAATQIYIIYKVAPCNYRYAIQIKNLVGLFVH